MSVAQLRTFREQARLTQQQVAKRLGVSQGYVSLCETGRRTPSSSFMKKLASVYRLPPTALPVHRTDRLSKVDPRELAESLASLGYPGFSYMRSRRKVNPAEVLLAALAQKNLESRLAEALPWLLLRFPDVDNRWLAREAKLHNLQNRLGFVVSLARRLSERTSDSKSLHALAQLQQELEQSRLAREDTFCQESLSEPERHWLREQRSHDARHWNLLTDWTPETIRYAQV
ncbi:MAG: helix-turn-helix domain-containing protein [Acidobacteriia bacterium]|nr:helix-turn-helix domain-containing protein [Terriglobia bacterium]